MTNNLFYKITMVLLKLALKMSGSYEAMIEISKDPNMQANVFEIIKLAKEQDKTLFDVIEIARDVYKCNSNH